MDMFFTGLFSHVWAGGRDIVVVPVGPATPEHLFRIVVADTDIELAKTNALDDGIFAKSGETSYYDLTGKLTISGLKVGGSRQLTSAFQTFVPKLTEVSGHNVLRQEILTQTPTSSLKAFLDHPPGKLAVVKYFEQQAVFVPEVEKWKTPRCIAAVVRLTLEADQEVVITNGRKTLTLKRSTSLISFWNEPKQNSMYHGDFSTYYTSMFEDRTDESIPVPTDAICTAEGDRVDSVECSNTQYP